jgi:hypothetical protein
MQYVGLDVADEETSVCVINQEGAVLAEAKVASEPAAIAAFIRSRAPQVRIPKQAGHLFRIDVGHRSDLIPARVPR